MRKTPGRVSWIRPTGSWLGCTVDPVQSSPSTFPWTWITGGTQISISCSSGNLSFCSFFFPIHPLPEPTLIPHVPLRLVLPFLSSPPHPSHSRSLASGSSVHHVQLLLSCDAADSYRPVKRLKQHCDVRSSQNSGSKCLIAFFSPTGEFCSLSSRQEP